jgi:hypothetical protein
MTKKTKTRLDVVEKIEVCVATALALSLVFAIGRSLMHREWTVFFVSFLTLLLFYLPAAIEKRLRIHLPVEMQFVIVAFVYASLFLGEVGDFYSKFWWWDIALHAGSGVGFGFAGFTILYSLFAHGKVHTSPSLLSTFAFCFSLAIGALWEIFEFAMDQLFAMNMQKSGLVDTMSDLIVDAIGALFASVLGFAYIKGVKPQLFARLMRRFINMNPEVY